MKQRLDRRLLPNYLEKEKRSNFFMLNYITVTHKIRGTLGIGRRLYITFEGAEYRSDVLSKSFDLVGYTLTLRFNPDDIRTCKSFFEDGSEFCDLFVYPLQISKYHLYIWYSYSFGFHLLVKG